MPFWQIFKVRARRHLPPPNQCNATNQNLRLLHAKRIILPFLRKNITSWRLQCEIEMLATQFKITKNITVFCVYTAKFWCRATQFYVLKKHYSPLRLHCQIVVPGSTILHHNQKRERKKELEYLPKKYFFNQWVRTWDKNPTHCVHLRHITTI